MKKITILFLLILINYYSFSQCTNTSSYGSATASATTGTSVTISTCNYQTEYSTVSGFVAGSTYSLTNSSGGCITVHSGSNSGPIVASGNAPLTFSPTVSGTYYISYNTNCGSCGTATNCGTTTVVTTSGSGVPNPPCTGGSNNSCNTADPFCSTNAYNYCNTTGVASAGTFGCLISTPNPMWMYLNIASSGNIDILMEQFTTAGTPIDVDFALYGPYGSLAAACPITGATPQVDCSFSAAATETGNIVGAVAGQFYMLLITNYNGQVGYIEFSQTGGGGSTNCAIVAPTCAILSVSATPSACNASNQYTVSGTVSVSNPPATGTMTVTNSCGGSQVFNAPFAASINYSIAGINATGGLCTITTTFSALPACTLTQTYTSPAIPLVNAGVDQIVCSGNPATLSGSGATSYTWTGGVTNGTAFTPGATSNYTVTGTNAQGCKATDIVNVAVNPKPVITAEPNLSYCATATVPLNSFVSTPAGATYTWANSNTAIGLAASGSGSVPAFTATNATGSAITSTITVTPTLAGCVGLPITYTITVNPNVTPTFTAVAPICSGAALAALPTTSTNGITGTWSPAINNTTTTLYTFTPTAGLCANTTTMTITVNPTITPTFAAVPPQCTGSAIAPLPTTSTNGITGTWSPAINNTATTLYTFTPAAGQCATTTTLTITITSSITPTFAAVGPYCSGTAISALPTTSTNGITGTWSPAINNTATTLYTFTPAAGQCATTTTLTITISSSITPTFTAVTAKCNGAVIAALPTVSNNAINGTWSPAINNTTTTLYTFTPTAGQCATTTTMTITVNPLPIPTAIADSVNCNGGSTGFVTVTGVVNSPGGFNYSWNTAPVQNTQTATGLTIGTYTVTVTDQNTTCTGQTTATIFQPPVLSATETHVNPTCAQGTNGTATANPTGGTAPYTYSWNTIPIQPTKTATGLAAGTYICTITDYHGCTTTTTATLVDPAGMVLNTVMSQANCGLPDGSATVSVTSGGSGNFSYSWNTAPVQNTAIASNIGAGTYIATVTDITLGCISKDTIIVTTTTGITATAVLINDVLCNGAANGSAYAFPTGGAPIYSYSWNTIPIQTNDTITAAAGTYTVTITDGSGCSGTANVTIGQPTIVVASISGSTDETCFGAANGTATAAGVGGTGVYTYSWNTTPIQTTNPATGLAPGTYTVTVSDGNLCPATANVTINPGPTMTASHTSTNVSCFGGANGAINVTVLGAPGAISYNWMPGSIGSEDPIGLVAGTYTLTATSMGCSVNDTVIISQPTQLVAAIDSVFDVICNGGADGHAHGSSIGGTGAHSYSWNTVPTQNTSAAFGLPTGTYTLTVTDANLCSTTVNAVINQPAPLAVNTGSMPAYCGVNQGTVWAFPTNGTAPYTFIWDSSGTVLGSNDTIGGLYPGSYHLQVLDNNGCKYIGDVTVVAAPGGTASISATTDVSCNGGSNGTATVSMSGAFPPYSYQWDAAAANQITNPATGLALGTYGVNVTDALGCVMSTTANITEPTPLTVGLIQNNTICPNSCDGTATATPSGGTSPYYYSWNGPSTQITQTAVSLCTGTFTVQITDDKGCLISDSIAINNPPAMELDSTFVAANCNQPDGSAEIFITANGTGPFTFAWTDGVSTISMTSQLSNVVAGTYFVTVTDFNLCSVTTSVTIPNLAGPQIDSTSFIDVLCFGDNNGTATVSVSGGATPYTYLWNDALNQTTPSAVNLIAGTYVVNVFDDNGCNLSTSIVVNEPFQLALTSGGIDPTCFGYTDGQVWVNALGGTMPYSYLWNDPMTTANDTANGLSVVGGGYTATVTDDNGCIETANVVLTDPALFTINVNGTDASCFGGNDGSAVVSENNGVSPFTYLWNDPSTQSTQTATGLIANNYSVTATDDNGCFATGSVVINEPPLLTIVQDTVLDVSCNGFSDGFASVTVNGGTGTYDFTWELGSTLVSTLQSPSTLTVGTYLVTVTDDNLCSSAIFITVNEPTPISANYFAIDALCAGDNSGYAYVTANGGVAPYTYQWDAAAALQQTDTASNLVTGTYDVVITDNNGCNFPLNGIFIDQPQPLTFLSSTSSPSTCGASNGEASVLVGGGLGALNFAWNSTPAQFTAIASNLSAGNYTVVVTDQNGCLDSTNVNVVDIGAPTVTITTSTDVSCNGAADGTATANVTGGTTPYTYLWNNANADTTLTATGLDALTYNITVTDSNGCTNSASIVIQQANALIAVIGTPPTNVSCNGGNNGAATAMTAGGTSPFTYQWNDAALQTTLAASTLIAGTYVFQVTDSNNCTASDTVTITEPAILVVGLDTSINVSCNGLSDGFIDINVTGGNFPYVSYVWTPNISIGQTASGLTQGSYDVVVTDTKGCTATNTFVINEPTALLITMDSTASTCGNANGSAEVASTVGGTTPYFYNWNDPTNQTTALASNLSANTYNVTVTDNNGCSISSSVTVNDLPGPIIDSFSVTNVVCFGELNGSATIYTTGGSVLNYTWTPSGQITPIAAGLGAGVYSVTVIDVNGCTTNQGGIIIAQPTVVTADINMPATACYGQAIQLFGIGNGGTPFTPPANPYNILWGPPFSITSPGPLYDTVTTNTTYNIVVQDANGCTKFYNESVVVGAPLNVSAPDSTICEGGKATIFANSTGGNSSNPFVYTWLIYDSLTGNTSVPLGVINPTNPVSLIPTSTTDYIVTVSDGCSINATTGFTVFVNDSSLVTINSIDTIGCPPLIVDFKATSVDGGLTYSWNYGDGVVQPTINDTTFHIYNNSGSYDVALTVTNLFGCKSAFYYPKYVEVYNVPSANFSADPQITTILNPEINFTDLSSIDVIDWNWDFGDLTTDTINQNPTHNYQDTGYYPVQLIVTNGLCYDTIEKIVQVKPDFFFAIPNTFTPDGDDLNEIFKPGSFVGVSEKEYNFYIFDRWGEKIWEGHDLEDGWNGTIKEGNKIAQTDTYVWLIKLKGIDGLHREYRGRVNILK